MHLHHIYLRIEDNFTLVTFPAKPDAHIQDICILHWYDLKLFREGFKKKKKLMEFSIKALSYTFAVDSYILLNRM